ncbi:YhcN/YlaJ family sporulation lipoprotein [Paenibacillus sacheonensis]|uniref:YhcN/YlaJ family sporulation lipoprotein n=1 Tax=Paenibacillus sacheonensis TaxID=742054 RepID=A0A7X5BZ34_9BACL|nr:YhcN/YlaJ family sporulation lipoprotein [Paenibacillus sacheonensis]MBM7565684.1 YhcN/YlaJ family sporulation lipoprotein [Paenibacillus sacheonensis]NBC72258.1 YhcN/YlaJ family sporulation lipoprotein [Paenibacillus sacheonensis]
MRKWLVPAMLLSLLAAGCNTVARNETSPSPQNDNRVRAQQSSPQKTTISSPKQVAAHLEDLARHVPGVKGAHCVVFKNKAVVGIDVAGNLDRSRVGTVKYAVAEAFHKDPYGVDAIVTADIDLSHRLSELGADIRRGRPLAGLGEEMADIIGRIVPQIPRDVQPMKMEPKSTEQKNLDRQLQQAGSKNQKKL